MRRKNALDNSKLIQISSKNSVIDVYVDAFPIERVKFRIADYNSPQTSIDIFMEFSDFLKVAHDAKTGDLFKMMAANKQQLIIARGGTSPQKANRSDGNAESRIMSLGMLNDKIYFNASLGAGTTTDTGLIKPLGQPEKKVSAMMTIGDAKKLFIYTEAAINAYLPTIVNKLVEAGQKNRGDFLKNTGQSLENTYHTQAEPVRNEPNPAQFSGPQRTQSYRVTPKTYQPTNVNPPQYGNQSFEEDEDDFGGYNGSALI